MYLWITGEPPDSCGMRVSRSRNTYFWWKELSLRVNALNIGHDVCFVHFESGLCLHYEDISRTVRRKHVRIDVHSDTSHYRDVLERIRELMSMYGADYWALTFDPGNFDEFSKILLFISTMWPVSPDHPHRDVWDELKSHGYVQLGRSIFIVEHSIAHVMSALATSPGNQATSKALLCSLDGWSTFSYDLAAQTTAAADIDLLHVKRNIFPVGGSFFDHYLSKLLFGYEDMTAPGKIMGLAAHGEVDAEMVTWLEECWEPVTEISAENDFYKLIDTISGVVERTEKRFPFLSRKGIVQTHNTQAKNFYTTAQEFFTDSIVRVTAALAQEFTTNTIFYAGGCALSIVTNSKLKKALPENSRLHIPPFADDSGQAYGAACFVNALLGTKNQLSPDFPWIGSKRSLPHQTVPLLGQALDTKEISRIAEYLAHGGLVAWFDGNHAVGPRALGCRSILASPGQPGIRDRLNLHVKHREWFRPYGGIVLRRRMGKIFDEEIDSPYMLYEVPVKPGYRESLDGCLSARGLCRIQTVEEGRLPFLCELLDRFETVTGIPCLINTSLNVGGKPIVSNETDAIEDCIHMGIDYLVLNGRILQLSKF
jgi:predicted NodU family carbamoyl transferase